MNSASKGMTLIEVMIVVLIMSILSSIAMPMYSDYTAKSRTSEVPMSLKSMAQTQIGFFEAEGHYASDLQTLEWKTSKGLIFEDGIWVSEGSYYVFSTSEEKTCNPGSGWNPSPDGLVMAEAMRPESVPPEYQAACMDALLTFKTNTP